MGYYIDFVFDPETPVTRKDTICRLDKAGAIKLKESYREISATSKKDGKMVMDPRRCGLYADFYYYGLWGIVTVYPREHYYLKGNWMVTRTSWGCSPEEIISVWEAVFELADKVGCRVYDGQKRGFIFPEDINRMVRFFFKAASGIAGMFGTVRN